MSASVTNSDGVTTICSPMATALGAAATGAPWMTLLKLPTDGEAETNNCNDGSGGSADCHDNNIVFHCCVLTTKAAGGPPTQDVKIRMASSNGSAVFYEDSTIYIDGGPNPGGNFCSSVGTAAH